MRCIEIICFIKLCFCPRLINRNMRCIEMRWCPPASVMDLWLIETWDVLKWQLKSTRNPWKMINRNMRCIEIHDLLIHLLVPAWINRNIRCIEIYRVPRLWCPLARLIETWDVLKFNYIGGRAAANFWLIETWDVLKLLNFLKSL